MPLAETALERAMKNKDMVAPGEDHRLTWTQFCSIMTSMELAHRAEVIAIEHPRMLLNVDIESPRIILRVDPESTDGISVVMEPGNLCVGSFHEGEVVIMSVDREVKDHGSDKQVEFINAFESDIANALGVAVTDVCHITVADVTVPAPDGDAHAGLRHLLRRHRDEFADILQSFDINRNGVLERELSDGFEGLLRSKLQSLAWDIDEDTYDKYCKVVSDYLDVDHDGNLSLCELGGDLAANRTIHGRTDVRVNFSLRPRDLSAAVCADALKAQAADSSSKLRTGATTGRVELLDIRVGDGIHSTNGQLDPHFFDNKHASWTDFQLSLEKCGHSDVTKSHPLIRDVLVSKFDLHAFVATCILPDFMMAGQEHLARTKARIDMYSSLNVQASMQDINDLSSVLFGILAKMQTPDAGPVDAPAPAPIPATVAHPDVRSLDVNCSFGRWTFRLNHSTKRPIMDFKTRIKVGNIVAQGGTLRCHVGLHSSAHYDNLHVGHWEPLLEPYDLSIAYSQSPRATQITMRSHQMMNLNVSHALMQNVVGSMNSSPAEAEELQMRTPFEIENQSGSVLSVRLGLQEPDSPTFDNLKFYHEPREIMDDSKVDVSMEEMRSANVHEALPERVLYVDFPASPWRSLVLSNLNKAGATKVLLHKRFEDSGAHQELLKQHPRRQPSHHDKTLIVAAARATTRSTVVHVDNQTSFLLVLDDEKWLALGSNAHPHPPQSIAPVRIHIASATRHAT